MSYNCHGNKYALLNFLFQVSAPLQLPFPLPVKHPNFPILTLHLPVNSQLRSLILVTEAFQMSTPLPSDSHSPVPTATRASGVHSHTHSFI